jgi:hypothetical protein
MSPERGDRRDDEPAEEDVLRALDRAARLEREIVAESRAPSSPGELRTVEATLRQAWEPAPRAVGRRRLWLAAAALVIAVFGLWRFLARDAPHEPPPGVVLGQNEVRILAPEGPVEAFTVLRWQTSTLGTPRFDVRVYDEPSGALLLRESDLRASELSLDNRDTSAWQRVRMEIDELDSSGEPVKSGRARAWRRSP